MFVVIVDSEIPAAHGGRIYQNFTYDPFRVEKQDSTMFL